MTKFYAGQLDPTLESIKYVGLDNWSRLFNYGSETFVTAIKNTFLFAGITTGFNIIGALIISSILNSKLVGKRKNLFMVLFFLPQVTSGIASAIIFIRLTGKSSIFGLDLVSNPQDAIWVMIITSIWGGISGGLITFNTAFAGIDSSQYESATLDSASVWMRFRAITIPSLGPILAYTLITSIIGGLGVFDQAYILNVVVPV